MLGSLTEADDALQDAWLRVSRADATTVDNLGGWLTTIVAHVCLNMLRSRNRRREEAFGVHLPDPVVTGEGRLQPEEEALLADQVGLALLVVLDSLSPAERLAFVLHDMFELPFDEIAPMLDRSPVAARQLASRARRRVKGAEIPTPDPDLARQREVVDAFFQAAREGDFDALVRLLHPDVVLRSDFGAKHRAASVVHRGAAAVAGQARGFPGAIVQSRHHRPRTADRRHGLYRRRGQDRRDRRDRRSATCPEDRRGSPRSVRSHRIRDTRHHLLELQSLRRP